MGSSSRFLMLLSPSSPFLHNHRPPSSLHRLSRHRILLSFHHHYFSPSCPLAPTTKNRKNSSFLLLKHSPRHFLTQSTSTNLANSALRAPPHHPWPEFSALLNNLSTAGYFNSPHPYNEFAAAAPEFPEQFLGVLNACLAFAHDRTDALRLLSRKEIEVVVQNGTPFLFMDGEESARRLTLFLASGESNVRDVDKANMVDLMRYLLSYASNVTASLERSNLYNRELVESSVRLLLGELAKLSGSSAVPNYPGNEHTQLPDRNGPMPRSFGQNVEMKRGDWVCPRCNFMNFARNVKCLECEEARPKRQLTGGEWECPQCDFFNYGRNRVCLRCDCKRPGEISLDNTYSRLGLTYSNGNSSNKADLDRRLAANEEKAQRWFSKVSQLDSTSDMSSAIADEDFPEIMPLRKGVNRFVVSTRKTPLERRLASAQYRRNMDNDGIPEHNNFQTGGENKTLDAKVNWRLDEILGRSSTTSASNDNSINGGAENPLSTSTSTAMQDGHPRGANSNSVPYVPLPADMFAKKPESSKIQESQKAVSNDQRSGVSNTVGQTDAVSRSEELNKSLESQQLSENIMNEKESSDKEQEQAEKSQRWFKKVAELHNVTDLANAIPDEDFPDIMPIRKGENRFVVSRKKDRSLTSPTYKRRAATEQAGNTNYVPFVPFPPGYFANKDKQQPEGTDSSAKVTGETSTSVTPEKHSEKLSEVSVAEENQETQSWSSKLSGENLNERRRDASTKAQTSGYSNQNSINPQTSNNDNLSSGNPMNDSRKRTTNLTGSSPQPSGDQNGMSTWSGKSLEGSAVKEPDPLDMSEEAKAERWFRRVAQIKDISELSQIPDEDFPSIMPMRKGVNRFVVSKRKTPLERRLTSQQYRRNLPTVNSDPEKKESDGS
ncbi:zinc finger protein VAR3, chloroplastic [Herrania umbratica]|uniref:Zinc finger protein VAR3, chloroplastic n=1 Tax=Herrania umbratica TaxID=108875 RepID=A0A6J1A5V6_9ROSI|nr:zinc finger protein VAR3, chloroplastic [Herrania umbratica]